MARLICESAAAKRHGLQRRDMTNLVRAGLLPEYRIPGRRHPVHDPEDVDRAIAATRATGPGPRPESAPPAPEITLDAAFARAWLEHWAHLERSYQHALMSRVSAQFGTISTHDGDADERETG